MSGVTALVPDTAEVYGLYGTWPRFRFAERDIGAKWRGVAAVDDASLARGGYALAGQIRDASDLEPEPQAELASLLRYGDLTPDQDARLAALLECCPFVENVPPVDVDPQDASPEETRAFARAFDAAWRAAGLGTVQWFTTGGRGLHGKLPLPPGVRSPHLMRSYGGLVRRVARAANLPLLSDHRPKKDRPPILLDDTLFDRDASGRGGLWRLEGARHSKTGRVKALATDLPTAPPEPTSALADRLAQSLDNLAQVADHGEIRRRPRERRGKLPAPLTELARAILLPSVGEAITKILPPVGMRHDFRKALAGWLLREGVPTRVAAATVGVAGDPADATSACKTTESRLRSGRNAYGFRKLIEQVGEGGALTLKVALHRDLSAAHVAPRDLGGLPSNADRATLKEAARLAEAAGNTTRALACRRAARCGIARHQTVCKRCRSTTGCRHLISERATCPHCAARRARSVLNWCLTKWPSRLWVLVRDLEDDSLETARAERKRWARKLRRERRGKVRWLIAPGLLAAITPDMHAGCVMAGWPNVDPRWRRSENAVNDLPKFDVALMLEPLLKARALKLRKHLDLADASGLAADAWCDKVMEASGGEEARATMPWPKKRDLRLMAVNAARARQNLEPLAPGVTFPSLSDQLRERSACCGSRQDYEVRDARTNELVAVRDDRPWLFAEGSVRAEQGWREERLEFDDAGLLQVHVPPVGWDETKLRE